MHLQQHSRLISNLRPEIARDPLDLKFLISRQQRSNKRTLPAALPRRRGFFRNYSQLHRVHGQINRLLFDKGGNGFYCSEGESQKVRPSKGLFLLSMTCHPI